MNGMMLAFLLLQTGTVTGRVLNVDGTPGARLRVVAQAMEETPAAAVNAPVFVSIVQTDAQGNYRLEGVPPGSFYIAAGMVDLPTYFPGVTTVAEARVVKVASGAVLRDIDFKLARSPGVTMRVHVKVEGDGTIPSNASGFVTGPEPGKIRYILLRGDGFVAESLPPGRYVVGVTPAPGVPNQQIFVGEKDVDVEITLKQTVRITGRTVVEGNGETPRVRLQFRDAVAKDISGAGSANDDGTFDFLLRVGTHQAAFGGIPPGYQVKSITAGSANWLKDNIVVESGKPVTDLIVVLEAN
jgi:hypothetical protein